MPQFTNSLITASSPYLLQHAHNPVNWYAWGEEVLEKAKREEKLILVSIGYSACHWCHVMEHESFEDTLVANLMNKYFISIKIDREERPDIDQVYMDAAQLMTNRGGWPLNVICLPDGRPIYAGTYFPKKEWMQLLTSIQDFYTKNPKKIKLQADHVQNGVNQMNTLSLKKEEKELSQKKLDSAANLWISTLDLKKGGGKTSIKFPMPISLISLLNYATENTNDQGKTAILLTLNQMAYGGIYDQLAGGFSRYSTDPDWHIPHFEKMLYDNAQLLSAYSIAYKLTKNPLYEQIIQETIAFCNKELFDGKAAYYSSLDADSEGEEGKYYVWSEDEVTAIIGTKQSNYLKYYDISKQGNWEGKNVLRVQKDISLFCSENNISSNDFKQEIKKNNRALLKAREKRTSPALDNKILTSWNALMIQGLSDAYEALGEEMYRKKAIKTGNFIWNTLWDGKQLQRSFKNDKTSINGFIIDYATSIQAFIKLYKITFDETWLIRANVFMEVCFKNFFNYKTGFFHFKSSEDSNLYVESSPIDDNVIPSGNSIMALNLFHLGHYLYNQEYLSYSHDMLLSAIPYMEKQPSFYYNWFELYRKNIKEPYEVVIIGDDADFFRKEMSKNYLPNTLLLGGKSEGNLALLKMKLVMNKTMIYVCQHKTCKLPVSTVLDALNQMK